MVNGLILQIYNKIKLLYSGLVSVQLEYTECYKVGDIYHFKNDYQCKGIIRKIRLCPEYGNYGITFITLQLI